MGPNLIEALILHCGLPEGYARIKLMSLIREAGMDVDNLQLDDIRLLAANLLQDVILQAPMDEVS